MAGLEEIPDDELHARNVELGAKREAILEEQHEIAAELDRRAAERAETRAAEAEAAGQVVHVDAVVDESSIMGSSSARKTTGAAKKAARTRKG